MRVSSPLAVSSSALDSSSNASFVRRSKLFNAKNFSVGDYMTRERALWAGNGMIGDVERLFVYKK